MAENGAFGGCFQRRSHTPVQGISPAALNALAAARRPPDFGARITPRAQS